MEENVQKSCWGIAAWTVLALGGILSLVYLFGGADAAHTAAVAIR